MADAGRPGTLPPRGAGMRTILGVMVGTWLGGCGGDAEPTDGADEVPTDADTDTDTDADSDTDADTDSDTDADTDVTGSTGDTAVAEPCAPDAALTVTASAAEGPLPNQLELSVTTSAAATVAALCVSDVDPSDAHLVEGTTPGTTHALRFLGLLSATDYTCTVNATCPTNGQPAVEVSHRTGAPPVRFPIFDLDVDPKLGRTGHYLMAPWQERVWMNTYVVVWGPDGKARWWWRTEDGVAVDIEALLDRGTTQIVYGGGDHPLGAPTVVDLWDGLTYRAALPQWGIDRYSHDTKRLADGRILSLQYVPNTDGRATWFGFGVRVHDQATGVIDFELDSQRFVDDGTLPPSTPNADPYHANWVDYLDQGSGPVLYVSLYGSQQIWALDGLTGDPLWRLGRNLGWTVLDEQGDPMPQSELPQGQHGCEVRGDELWVYDNGVQRFRSRAEKWRIDPVAMTAQRTWMWTEPGWYEPILGDIDDLGNGRAFVTKATIGTVLQPTDMVEIDMATNRVAARWTTPDPLNTGYRSEIYDGCDLFANVSTCEALADRAAVLEPLLR